MRMAFTNLKASLTSARDSFSLYQIEYGAIFDCSKQLQIQNVNEIQHLYIHQQR